MTDRVTEEGQLPRTDTAFVFHNLPIPVCNITKSNEAEILATLKKALELRLQGQEEFRKYITVERKCGETSRKKIDLYFLFMFVVN